MKLREIDLSKEELPVVFRVGCCVAPSGGGSRVLELGLMLATGEPVVVDRTNQRAYVGSWDELIEHASLRLDRPVIYGGATCH